MLFRSSDTSHWLELPAVPSAHGVIAAQYSKENPIVLVTASTRRAEELAAEIRAYIGDRVVEFPPWETLPHERLSPKSDTIVNRFKAIYSLKNDSKISVIVTSIRALIQPIAPTINETPPLSISIDLEIAIATLVETLSSFGYLRTDLVEKRGEFAVRGGILDLFPADYEHPIRIDFFGEKKIFPIFLSATSEPFNQ